MTSRAMTSDLSTAPHTNKQFTSEVDKSLDISPTRYKIDAQFWLKTNRVMRSIEWWQCASFCQLYSNFEENAEISIHRRKFKRDQKTTVSRRHHRVILCENMTSFTEPEVRNVLHRRHSRTESMPWERRSKFRELGTRGFWLLRYAGKLTYRQTDIQTYRRADGNTSHFCSTFVNVKWPLIVLSLWPLSFSVINRLFYSG